MCVSELGIGACRCRIGETGSRYTVWLLGSGIEVEATRLGTPNVTDGGGCPDAEVRIRAPGSDKIGANASEEAEILVAGAS
jgi:hypothetical protein